MCTFGSCAPLPYLLHILSRAQYYPNIILKVSHVSSLMQKLRFSGCPRQKASYNGTLLDHILIPVLRFQEESIHLSLSHVFLLLLHVCYIYSYHFYI